MLSDIAERSLRTPTYIDGRHVAAERLLRGILRAAGDSRLLLMASGGKAKELPERLVSYLLGRQYIVVQACQHDQSRIRAHGDFARNTVETVDARKTQAPQYDINFAFRKMKDGVTYAEGVGQIKAAMRFHAQHLAKQAGISGVIFDQKNPERLIIHKSL